MKYTVGLLAACFYSAEASPERSHESIAEIIEKVNNNPEISWTAGVNKKFDPTKKPSEYAYLMGTILGEERLPEKAIQVAASIPDAFDPREQWPNCNVLNEVRDQGTCGSCWAFGAVSAFSDRVCIQSNGAMDLDISAEDVLACCRTCGMGCNGGYLGPTWQYMTGGVCSGGLYDGTGCKPYSIAPCEHHTTGDRPDCADLPNSKTPACTNTCVSGYSDNTYANDKVSGLNAYSVGNMRNLDVIQTELMTNGPIEVSFTVYEDFMSYTGGVYYHTSGKSLGGHAIKLMGWGVDEDTNMPYWLLVNSWNSDWGEQGWFRMRRGTNECGLENSGTAGMIDV